VGATVSLGLKAVEFALRCGEDLQNKSPVHCGADEQSLLFQILLPQSQISVLETCDLVFDTKVALA